ncbi:cysteine proteinase [Guyanagaster necrorhizus]|uniref:Cysteine proteinase n=1 Tax=Guyanagaster necrorhizus TaxID=856835 RepID=A0A9P7VMG0_9AGAR|nr:cysteine proteinase [Guyanagaster necrorhizus MCA 3950]KAG7443142.1 cysteine proteinase [Guyanagaster necrorhizus MCA 3950]
MASVARKKLEELHGIGPSAPNHRDASISGPNKVWQNKPTPISVPTPSHGLCNPFSGSRFQDNLHDSRKQQLRSAARTEITSNSNSSHRPLKRRKINDPKPRNSRSNMPPLARGDDSDVIILDLDGLEDTGQRIAQPSSDEIDFIPRIPGTKHIDQRIAQSSGELNSLPRMPNVKQPERHAFDEDRPLPNSGIEFLKNKHGRSTSPIESFDCPMPAPKKPGMVKEMVNQIEKRTDRVQSSVDVPHIDLRAKEKMKSKDNKVQGRRVLPQRASDAPFNPIRSDKINVGEWTLPLKDYMLGVEHVENNCSIHCSKKKGTFELRNGSLSSQSRSFKIDRDVNQFQGMEKTKEHPVFTLQSTHDEGVRVEKNALFVPGDEGQKGQICVRFDKRHPKWYGSVFDATLAWFRANIKDSAIVRQENVLWDAASVPETDPVDVDAVARGSWSPPSIESVSSASTSHQSEPGQKNSRQLHANGKAKSSSVVAYEPTQESISAPRRSTRHSDAPPKPPEEEPDELVLVYPWGTTGGVNLSKSDLNRLRPGEYLNDNLIELGLKMWHSRLERENPGLANDIYVFSSFFYKKLSVKNSDEGYNAVRRWTSKTDIFAKKYIIVPINENFHWYLAIIYQPEHILLPPLETKSPATRGRTRQSNVTSASPSADPLREFSRGAMALDDSSVSANILSSEAQETQDVEELLRLSQSCRIEEEPLEGSTAEVHDLDMHKSPNDDARMDVDPEIPADFRRASLSPTADDRPQGYLSDMVSDDEGIRSDEAQATASGSESQTLSPRFEGETTGDMIEIDTAHSLFDDDENFESASAHAEESVSCPGAISPSWFYASTDRKGKRKAEPQADPVITAGDPQSPQKGKLKVYSSRKRKAGDDADTQVEFPDDDEVVIFDGRPSTYIFTMDSLGSRHPRVIGVLGNYLRLEAIDKKGIEISSKPIGKQALVPVQPNFCDCGIYLIHFAQTFMSDPARYCNIIAAPKGSGNMQKDRKVVWKAEDIGGMREGLRGQLLELSKEWRVWKGKEKEKEKDDVTMIESSDSEVDIVEVETTPTPVAEGQTKGKTRSGSKGGKRKANW